MWMVINCSIKRGPIIADVAVLEFAKSSGFNIRDYAMQVSGTPRWLLRGVIGKWPGICEWGNAEVWGGAGVGQGWERGRQKRRTGWLGEAGFEWVAHGPLSAAGRW